MNYFKQYKLIAAISLLGLILISCSKSETPSAQSNLNKQQTEEVKKEKPLGVNDVPDEIYGDKEMLSTPRLQFVVRIPESGLQEIWSSRLDGSDVRRAVHAEVLHSPMEGEINHPPIRSPNNRFIAYSFNTKNGIKRQLIDLKEMTVNVVADGGGIPSFQWTPDSIHLLFGLVGGDYNDIVQYNINTKALNKKKLFKTSGGFYLVPPNNNIISVTYQGFNEYGFNGNLLREVKVADRIQNYPYYSVSNSGDKFMYFYQSNTHIVKLTDPKKTIATLKMMPGLFHPNGKDIMYLKTGHLMQHTIASGKSKKLLELQYRILHMSLYNIN